MKLDIPLTQAGLKNAIRVLRQRQQWLQRKTDELAQELAERGMSDARIRFQNAEYDGMKDVSVSVQKTGENTYATVAVGSAVLFIEFGTGIRYIAPAHPDADQLGYPRRIRQTSRFERRRLGVRRCVWRHTWTSGQQRADQVAHLRQSGKYVHVLYRTRLETRAGTDCKGGIRR